MSSAATILLLALPAFVAGACPVVQAAATAPKPDVLPELSGLGASQRHPGVVYGHNDSGGSARFFAFEPGGAVRATFLLADVNAIDWEDIAVAEVDGQTWVYLADTGNNDLNRAEVAVYRVPEPELPVSNREVILSDAERLRIAFPSSNEDAEGLAVEPETGALILVTRDRDDSDATRLYRVEPKTDDTVAVPVLVRTLPDPSNGYKTKGADWLPGQRFALLRHSNNTGGTQLVTWPAPAGDSLATITLALPCVDTLDSFEQAEALCFLDGGGEILVGGEGDSDPLRRYRVADPQSGGWRVW
ncbi:MAG: hypothetical protein PWP23_989 [Candidatus Sumerlaeota bacterium]|nr:hypothetical protein [Candidatus Sumerlaeota bacterium]